MPQRQALTDADLIEMANDGSVTSADVAMLTPAERQRFVALKQSSPNDEHANTLMDKLSGAAGDAVDVVSGAGKGALSTANNLGNAVHSIPGIGNITDWLAKKVGPEGTDPSTAFAGADAQLQPTNKAESAGKLLEQIAEFFVPAGKVGLAATNIPKMSAVDFFLNTPKAAGPVRRMLGNVAMPAAQMAGDALGAGAVSAAHGERDPQYAAEGQLAGSAGGEALAQISKLLATKTGAQIGPLLAAIAAMSAIDGMGGAVSGGGMGAGLGTFGVTRALARRALQEPGAVGKLGWKLAEGGDAAGKLAAGAIDQSRAPQRRKLPQ